MDRVAAAEVAAAVADAHRREWAFVLAATVRVARDLDLAQECVQDAYAKALCTWPATGIPAKPGAWLTTTARNRALDLVRREARLRSKLPLLVPDAEAVEDAADIAASEVGEPPPIPDDRLRLLCTCCHPALAPEARVALTLRLVCGLTTAEVARAFLVAEPTMAARITRAKKKIAAARIPYAVPSAADLDERVASVLAVVHLVFTTGHSAPAGDALVRADLVTRATDLARLLHRLLPGNAEVAGLLALVLLTDARREARTDEAGHAVLLPDQDRTRWDRAAIAEGLALVGDAVTRRRPGRYVLQAAIAAVHADAPDWDATDWGEIVGLYDRLVATWPSPVVALNRAAAIGLAEGPAAGLAALEPLAREPQLATYPYLAATRADFLRQLGDARAARIAYEEALLLTSNEVEREFLAGRLEGLAQRPL